MKVTLINAFHVFYCQTKNMTYSIFERLKMMCNRQKLGHFILKMYIWRIFDPNSLRISPHTVKVFPGAMTVKHLRHKSI
jgi:hypothetical protein